MHSFFKPHGRRYQKIRNNFFNIQIIAYELPDAYPCAARPRTMSQGLIAPRYPFLSRFYTEFPEKVKIIC